MTATRVQRLLYASAFVRAMATGTAGVTLGGFLGKLDAGGLELGIVVRVAAWAVAPGFAGLIMTGDTMFLPLVIGAGMKICYDLILWRAFRGIKPPEERT